MHSLVTGSFSFCNISDTRLCGCVNLQFTPVYCSEVFHCINRTQHFSLLLADRHLDCFQFSIIVNKPHLCASIYVVWSYILTTQII